MRTTKFFLFFVGLFLACPPWAEAQKKPVCNPESSWAQEWGFPESANQSGMAWTVSFDELVKAGRIPSNGAKSLLKHDKNAKGLIGKSVGEFRIYHNACNNERKIGYRLVELPPEPPISDIREVSPQATAAMSGQTQQGTPVGNSVRNNIISALAGSGASYYLGKLHPAGFLAGIVVGPLVNKILPKPKLVSITGADSVKEPKLSAKPKTTVISADSSAENQRPLPPPLPKAKGRWY